MAQASSVNGDLFVAGNIACQTLTIPASTITDAAVAAAAALAHTKLQHQHAKTYSNESATVAATGKWGMHIVRGLTATMFKFDAALVVACIGNSTVTVDLLKNGVSLLNAVLSFSSADAARLIKTATFSSSALVVGDELEVSIVATVGTGTLGKGVIAELRVAEDAQ